MLRSPLSQKVPLLSRCVEETGGELGIDNLQLDEDNCCCLSFDSTVLNMEFDEEQGRLLCYSNVGDIPKHAQAEFYQMLLDANFFGKELAGTL